MKALLKGVSFAAGFAEDEATAVDIISQAFLLLVRKLRRKSAVKKQHGRLQQVFYTGRFRIDDLPGEVAFPFGFDVGGEVGKIAAMTPCRLPSSSLQIELAREPASRPLLDTSHERR
jgi:hypothetical protein